MKINEVAKETGLTKKAIHFYIKEELLKPEINADNGYYEFSPQDIQTLQNIALLRQLGMPVTEVKSMLQNPQMSCYYIHNLLENLRPELHDLMQKVQKLIYLLDTLPPKTDVDFLRTNSLSGRLNFEDQIERIYKLYFHDENAVMLSILIWGAFLNVSATEYRSYLWKRLVDLARREIEDSLRPAYLYFMTMTREQINDESIRRYFLTMEAADLSPETMEDYHQKCLASLRALSRDQELMDRWKQVYHPILLPLMHFAEHAGRFISEYNPKYIPFQQNTRLCCRMLIQDFKKSEIRLLRDLEEGMDGMFDLTCQDGLILSVMYTYAQSAFSILPRTKVQKLLEDSGFFQ